jgi:hypothetical protein
LKRRTQTPTIKISSATVIKVKGLAQKTSKHPQFGISIPRKTVRLGNKVKQICKAIVAKAVIFIAK